MGYYKVLSMPMFDAHKYKGLYRCEPFPKADDCCRFFSLWERYVQYHENKNEMGIVAELDLAELTEFAVLATKLSGEKFELVFFDEIRECSTDFTYYGIDVVSFGGYSMVGEDCFRPSDRADGVLGLFDVLNLHFRAKLNCNGLFDKTEDATSFQAVLNDLLVLSPNCIEQERWKIVHVFGCSENDSFCFLDSHSA